MTPLEESKIREIMDTYKSQPMRGTSIHGYSRYAMESAMQRAYMLGKVSVLDNTLEKMKEIKELLNK